MKKKVLLVLLLILALAMTMLFTGCGGSSSDSAAPSETAEEETAVVPDETEEPVTPLTLEEYAKTDSSIQDNLGVDEESGILVHIKGNELFFTYDYSKMEGDFTREKVVTDSYRDTLKEVMSDTGAGITFGNIAKTMEEASGIEGITVTVEYTWEDEIIYSQSFTASDSES